MICPGGLCCSVNKTRPRIRGDVLQILLRIPTVISGIETRFLIE